VCAANSSAKLFALFCEPFVANALLGLYSEEGCRTSAAEMLAIDFQVPGFSLAYQVQHVKGSVATSMTEP
jgi:hypothetical protein